MIIKHVLIALVFPLLLLAFLKAVDAFFQGTDLYAFHSIITSLWHVLYLWPLMAIEATGFIRGNSEVFYEEWGAVSLMFSVSMQVLVAYLLYQPEEEDA